MSELSYRNCTDEECNNSICYDCYYYGGLKIGFHTCDRIWTCYISLRAECKYFRRVDGE